MSLLLRVELMEDAGNGSVDGFWRFCSAGFVIGKKVEFQFRLPYCLPINGVLVDTNALESANAFVQQGVYDSIQAEEITHLLLKSLVFHV